MTAPSHRAVPRAPLLLHHCNRPFGNKPSLNDLDLREHLPPVGALTQVSWKSDPLQVPIGVALAVSSTDPAPRQAQRPAHGKAQ